MFSWIEDDPRLGRVDVCVANAGLSTPGTLLECKGRASFESKNGLLMDVSLQLPSRTGAL